MSEPVVDESETRGMSRNATFKVAASPYKSVIMEMQKIIEDNKPAEMEFEKAFPMIEQRMLNPRTNQHQNYFNHRACFFEFHLGWLIVFNYFLHFHNY